MGRNGGVAGAVARALPPTRPATTPSASAGHGRPAQLRGGSSRLCYAVAETDMKRALRTIQASVVVGVSMALGAALALAYALFVLPEGSGRTVLVGVDGVLGRVPVRL